MNSSILFNALKLAIRSLYRDKLYASISIIGLSLAMACCLIIGLYLKHELSYDKNFQNYERIFRVANAYYDYDTGSQRRELAITSPVLGPILEENFSEIEQAVRFRPLPSDVLIQHESDVYFWDRAYYVDDNVFEVFSHEVLAGDPKTALVDPSSMAVSQSFARQYFGEQSAVGEVVTLENGETRRILLVFQDLPENVHLKYDVLFSHNLDELKIAETEITRWLFGVNTYTYLLMPEGYSAEQFQPLASQFYQNYMEELSRERTNRAWSGWIQPLANIHLGQDLLNDLPTGNRLNLYTLASVVIFILLIAASNYTNISTAGFAKRNKEVSVRKVLGERKSSLFLQFLSESVALSLIAMTLGYIVVEFLINRGTLSAMTSNMVLQSFNTETSVAWAMTIVAIAFGLLAGIYPALHLSSMKPQFGTIARRSNLGLDKLKFNNFLLLLQFTVSVIVITCVLLMLIQLRFLTNQPLGFSKDNRIVITLRGQELISQLSVIENELQSHDDVVGVTFATSIMGQNFSVNSTGFETNSGEVESVQMAHMGVADNFIDVMDMEVLEGRSFNPGIATDALAAVIVNEALVEYMQWDEPIGKTVRATWGTRGTVIAVVENFNFKSMHSGIEPFYMYQPQFSNADRLGSEWSLVVHWSGENRNDTLEFIENRLMAFDNQQVGIEYSLLEDSLDDLYSSERLLMYLLACFASICLTITCLGLFGLAGVTAERRTREIGIRKVLGASPFQLIALLCRSVVVTVLIASLIAWVVSFVIMSQWVQVFAYRTDLNYAVFLLASIICLIIAMATLSLQAWRVARKNPVSVLKYE